MISPRTTRNAAWMLAVLAVLSAVTAGFILRLEEPMSTNVVPAEDPFTHMALVRGHLRDGGLDALYDGGTLYPPGMHAVLAAGWVYTGADLEQVFLVAPAVFGAVSILGVAILLSRSEGAVAAFVGALAIALAPEHIFRTTMMAPTALDLAVLPFFLYGALEITRGRLAWAGVLAPLTLFFVLAHPWLLAIVAPAAFALAALALLFPWSASKSQRFVAGGMAMVLLILGGGLGTALTMCWSQCGLGFQDISLPSVSAGLDLMVGIAAAACFAAAALLVVLRRSVARHQERRGERPLPWGVRAVASAAIGAIVLALTILAVRQGMPEHVDLPRMLGWPLLGLAAFALMALPFHRTPVAQIGGALTAVTYPFVVFNPMQSPYWPHRTAVFLGIGVALLAGVAASIVIRSVAAAMRAASARRSGSSHPVRSVVAGASLSLLVAMGMGGTVYAATPAEYDHGWYRLYPECEYEKMKDLVRQEDPDTIFIAGDWRPKLVMAAFADDPENVWFDYEFYTQTDHREDTAGGLYSQGREVVVVVDRHLMLEHREVDTSFLESGEWTHMGSWCDQGVSQPRLAAYRYGGDA